MKKMSREEVLKLAKLARISLSDSEIEEFSREFTAIIDYISQLKEVDVKDLDPTSQVTGLTNVLRKDKIIDYGYSPSKLLKNVPLVQDNQIKVRRMVG